MTLFSINWNVNWTSPFKYVDDIKYGIISFCVDQEKLDKNHIQNLFLYLQKEIMEGHSFPF